MCSTFDHPRTCLDAVCINTRSSSVLAGKSKNPPYRLQVILVKSRQQKEEDEFWSMVVAFAVDGDGGRKEVMVRK